MRRDRLARAGLILACAALVAWVRLLPLGLDALSTRAASPEQLEKLEAERRYTAADGREYVYLDDLDSYLWLRHARNLLEHGSTCTAIVDGDCRDTAAHAPVGRHDRYAGSVHPFAIAAVHRIATLFDAGFPLAASSFLVPLLVGVATVLPAFAIGARLGGALGGVAAALLIGFDPFFLLRSGGSDNDVWNVALPLFLVWGILAALDAKTTGRRFAAALSAAIVVGLHAATWRGWVFGYGVAMAGLVTSLVVEWIRSLIDRRARRAGDGPPYVVALILLAAGALSLLWRNAGSLAELNRVPSALPDVPWPDLLATVGELSRADLHRVIELTCTPLVFLASVACLVLISLPRRGWRWWYLAVVVAGVVLARSALVADAGRTATTAAIGAPLVVAAILAALARDETTAGERAAQLIVGFWFLGALHAAVGGTRFALLFVAPLGLAGAGLGRAQEIVADSLEARLPRVARAWLRPALFIALLAALLTPLQLGIAVARSRVPQMRDVWWDAFTHLAETSPPESIVHVWWDRGYWAEFVAQRRVNNDGASLLTHVPYWFARALLAGDERESAGLFRMLGCGSDTWPEPEGDAGAYARLVAAGVDPLRAPALVAELAGLEREAAAARLAENGIEPPAREAILAATHCEPPPSYLVISNRMAETISWRQVGSWSFERAFAAQAATRLPAAELEPALRAKLGLDEEAAAAMAEEVRNHRDGLQDFASEASFYLTPDWIPCTTTADDEWSCKIPINPRRLSRFVYRPQAPAESAIVSRLPSGRETSGPPGVIVAAGDSSRQVFEPEEPENPSLGVLVDLVGKRILVGSTSLIRSTFTDLVFLDGRTSPRFEKVDEQRAVDGERVTSWRVKEGAGG